MAESFKDQIAETATKVGHTLSEKTEQAADWAKETAHAVGHRIEEVAGKAEHKAQATFGETGPAGTTADIAEHMDVIGSCGTRLGRVDHVEGSKIKLTKSDSPDGAHHYIPVGWVGRVDQHVHLTKSCAEAEAGWQTA